jgi:bifunctional lysine-specific demethylase and histidyl-hydroxylase NO66
VRMEQITTSAASSGSQQPAVGGQSGEAGDVGGSLPWLRRCVGDPKEFLSRDWTAAPALHRGCQGAFSDLFSVPELERLLAMDALSRPKVKVVRGGIAAAPEAFSRVVGAREGSRGSIFDCARIASLIRAGGTLVVSSAEQGSHGLFLLCCGLEDELSHRVTTNVYLSPPAAQALKPHYDSHDVLILQIAGSKEWRVFGRQIDAGNHPDNVCVSPGQRPSLRAVLKSGDSLYLPKGYVHVVETAEDFSLHVTVVIMKIPVVDLLRYALESLAGSVVLSAPLPVRFLVREELLAGHLEEAARFMADQISSTEKRDELVRSFCQHWHLGSRSDQLGPIARALEPTAAAYS